jgi:serine/threonine-protein kinase HipA
MDRVANVYYQGQLAGELESIANGYTFTYNESYLAGGVPISFQLQLREEPYVSEELMPFFENLVSEGWLRKLQSQQQNIDEHDRFGLLISNGKDLVGAVTVESKETENGQER